MNIINFKNDFMPGTLPPREGPAQAQAPALLEQLLGVFTEPAALFRRLAGTPRWAGALAATMAFALAMVLVWAARVDAEALLRPILAQDPRVPSQSVDAIIQIQSGLLGWSAAAQVLAGMPVLALVLAALLWLVGRIVGPRPESGWPHALSAAVVPGLVFIPKYLLITALCLVRPDLDQMPEQISPLSLGAWMGPERGVPASLLTGFDLFAVAGLVLLFLSARHTLRLGWGGALACAVAAALLHTGILVATTT